ncbi:MAG: hypothetical protein V3U76_10275 [Granulosicoccus sp.]
MKNMKLARKTYSLRRRLRSISAMLSCALAMVSAPVATADVTGPLKMIALRVYFQDYIEESRFNTVQFETLTNSIDKLWRDTSYGNSSLDWQISELYQLPDNRSAYIDDLGNGDLSNGGKFMKVLNDAIANAPSGIDWTDIDGVTIMMSETSSAQFHRGQATSCPLSMGPGGSTSTVGCGIFSENPSSSEIAVWGRMAHEVGHMFQQGGPAHPSNYNSEFELMDANYPGQIGVFEKQPMMGFPGWLSESRYLEIEPADDGQSQCIVAMEYNLSGIPNYQAIKAKITDSLYYLISVRRKVLGDDLNPQYGGIPDEGVLIERVSEGSDPWVVIQGRGGDRSDLWEEGDVYSNLPDGMFIAIKRQYDPDTYCITVRYTQGSNQPDVAMYPWRQAPGNTYETTDIWNDSPVNGYGTYRYGTWNDLEGVSVPTGNGDDPAVGLDNRLYARVRNWGSSVATDVVVNFEVTDPLGLGIAGSNGWASLGTVDMNDFPALASIAPGDYVDVYVVWQPEVELTPDQLAAGTFSFHSCVRVKINPVAGEVALGNQDGKREQENISVFEASAVEAGMPYKNVVHLHNDDLVNKKYFYLSYESDLPEGWILDVNGGDLSVLLNPGEMRDIPVYIEPKYAAELGSVHGVDIDASSQRVLVNDLDPTDTHLEFQLLGGVRIEARSVQPTKLYCKVSDSGEIVVKGELGAEGLDTLAEKGLPAVLIQGLDKKGRYMKDRGASVLAKIGKGGQFAGELFSKKGDIAAVRCLFAGTELLASGATDIIKVR